MFRIVNKQIVAKDVKRLDVLAEPIAQHAQPGQFVMVVAFEEGEWIPLTIVEADPRRGTIALILQEEGFATRRLGAMPIAETLYAIMGPLGKPACIEHDGVVVCVATGVGAAQILPICRAYKNAGNKVIGITGAATKQSLMLEPQMRLSCHTLYITTEDGSYSRRGTATSLLKELLDKEPVDRVYAVGTLDMMQAVCALTKERGVATRVQVNPYMGCGTGLCGSCRIHVGGQLCLACQDGPEFDGHAIDFEEMKVRRDAFESI